MAASQPAYRSTHICTLFPKYLTKTSTCNNFFGLNQTIVFTLYLYTSCSPLSLEPVCAYWHTSLLSSCCALSRDFFFRFLHFRRACNQCANLPPRPPLLPPTFTPLEPVPFTFISRCSSVPHLLHPLHVRHGATVPNFFFVAVIRRPHRPQMPFHTQP